MVEVSGASCLNDRAPANVSTGWYIPPTWTEAENNTRCVDTSKNVLDAAECALALALANRAFINNSLIPLIVHQTWRSLATGTWPRPVQECVEQWVSFATGQPSGRDQKNMAWFIWDDNGVYSFIAKYEADFHPLFTSLPYPVEKSDVFRVLVLKWFGGIVSLQCKNDSGCLTDRLIVRGCRLQADKAPIQLDRLKQPGQMDRYRQKRARVANANGTSVHCSHYRTIDISRAVRVDPSIAIPQGGRCHRAVWD